MASGIGCFIGWFQVKDDKICKDIVALKAVNETPLKNELEIKRRKVRWPVRNNYECYI
jgi:hypothetical protein